MTSEPLAQKLANYLLENFRVDKSRRGKIKIDDFTLAGNGVASRFFKTIIQKNKTMIKDVKEDWLLLSDDDIKKEIENILPTALEFIETHLNNKEIDTVQENIDLPNSRSTYLNYIPVIDMESPKGSAKMINKLTSRVSPTLEEKAWERAVGPQHAKLVWELAYTGHFEYKPKDLTPFKIQNTPNGDETIYNTYYPPGHRVERDRSAELDPRYIKFLETFFDEGCRQYAYNWLYYSTFQKMETYLVLASAKRFLPIPPAPTRTKYVSIFWKVE